MSSVIDIVYRPPSGCNNNNEYAWTPCIFDNKTVIMVDTTWYSRQLAWIKSSFHENFPDAIVANISLPHDTPPNLCNDGMLAFYRWWAGLYDFKYFIDCVPDASYIQLSSTAIDELRDMCTVGITRPDHVPNLEAYPCLEADVVPQMKKILSDYRCVGKGAFIKTSRKSSKNDRRLEESHTISDLFDNIIHSTEVAKRMYCISGLVMKPWDDNLNVNTEFRVFIEDSRIIGVAQQFWYKRFTIVPTQEYADALIVIVCEKIIPKLPYVDAVLDIKWDGSSVRLLEVNPGGRWHSSGASLFRWEELFTEKILFRLHI